MMLPGSNSMSLRHNRGCGGPVEVLVRVVEAIYKDTQASANVLVRYLYISVSLLRTLCACLKWAADKACCGVMAWL